MEKEELNKKIKTLEDLIKGISESQKDETKIQARKNAKNLRKIKNILISALILLLINLGLLINLRLYLPMIIENVFDNYTFVEKVDKIDSEVTQDASGDNNDRDIIVNFGEDDG